jgi:molybdopterin-guanine dinucleotide biosynthesis protein A
LTIEDRMALRCRFSIGNYQFSISTSMHRCFGQLSGFVLAGGASQRMGRPKVELLLGGETMLGRQIRLLGSVCRSVAVVGLPENSPPGAVPFLPDDLPGCGPLGGIYTGLRHTRTEFNLFVGCDLPYVDVQFLHYLARRALESQADVTVPESIERRVQPLCAMYRRRTLAVIRVGLEAGKHKTSGFYHRVPWQVLPWPELARAGFPRRIFANMNTAEEYEGALQRSKCEG